MSDAVAVQSEGVTATPSSTTYRPYEGMRAVLYARVSTNDKGQTNETQVRAMKQWCETNGVKIVQIYKDEESGTTLSRDEFSKMIVHILTPPYGVDMLLAYDQSRLTRDKKIEDIMKMVEPSGCIVRFVKMELDPTSFEGDIINAVIERVDKRENDVRRDKTKQGMLTRKSEGKHVGRPARFMFTEDIESAPEGRYQRPDPENDIKGTITATEQYIYSFAREGKSLYYVARTVLGIDHHTLINEMRQKPKVVPTDERGNPLDRAKGVKDRYTVYMDILSRANGREEGSQGERVGSETEITGERVRE